MKGQICKPIDNIAASEWVGEQLVGPNLNTMTGDFPQIIGKIRTWADQ